MCAASCSIHSACDHCLTFCWQRHECAAGREVKSRNYYQRTLWILSFDTRIVPYECRTRSKSENVEHFFCRLVKQTATALKWGKNYSFTWPRSVSFSSSTTLFFLLLHSFIIVMQFAIVLYVYRDEEKSEVSRQLYLFCRLAHCVWETFNIHNRVALGQSRRCVPSRIHMFQL